MDFPWTKPGVRDIENAFLPAREITDSKIFAGRVTAVENAFRALISEGANLAIYGNKGIGKSSLARQIIKIANGENELLKKHDISHEGRLDFLAVYLACGGIQDIPSLLSTLLTSNQCLGDWIYDIPKAKRVIESIQPEISAAVFTLSGEKKTEKISEKAISEHEIMTVFTNVADEIAKSGIARDGLLIVADEFDQITNRSGFATFLKSLATNVPSVRFCLVGVANDIQTLMKEHSSADRLFAGAMIDLPPMDPNELNEIIDNAEKSIKSTITFDTSARNSLVDFAKGHPYMIHLIGKFALRAAHVNQVKIISSQGIEDSLSEIATRNGDPILEGRYKKAVAHSFQREAVLKAMAQVEERNEVYTSDAYKLAIDWGVDNASQYVGHLVTDDYGAEIEKVRERYYRFKDSLFRAYVMARPWLF